MAPRSKNRTLFTRSRPVGDAIVQMLGKTHRTIDAALYRLSHPRLARALHEAARRGVKVRVVLDREKYRLTPATQELLAKFDIPHRLMSGRRGRFAKMHHKFAILDGGTVLAGSYNWTLESENQNYECLIVLHDHREVAEFMGEFEALWASAARHPRTTRLSSRH